MPTQRSGAHWAPSEIDAQRLTDQLRASRLTVLCGGPGAPTPQVLQAGVLPRVHRRAEDRGKAERPAAAKALPFEDRRHGSDAEVSVLFDQWDASARAALKNALQQAVRGHGAGRGGKLPQRFGDLVIALSERHRVRFLLLFDRFEDCLLAPPESADLRALRDEIFSAVNRAQVPAHFLLTLREDEEPLLDRLRGRIRGFEPVRKPFPLDGAQGIGPWTLSWVPPVLAPARSRPPQTQAVYASIEALLGQMAQRTGPVSAEDAALLLPAPEGAQGLAPAEDDADTPFGPLAFTAYGLAPDAPSDSASAPLADDEHWSAFDVLPEADASPAPARRAADAPVEAPPALGAPGRPDIVMPEVPEVPAAAGPAAAATDAGSAGALASEGAAAVPDAPAPARADPPTHAPALPAARSSAAAGHRDTRSPAARGAAFSAASLAQFMAELDDVIAESTASADAAASKQSAPPLPLPPVLADLDRWSDALGPDGPEATAVPAEAVDPLPAPAADVPGFQSSWPAPQEAVASEPAPTAGADGAGMPPQASAEPVTATEALNANETPVAEALGPRETAAEPIAQLMAEPIVGPNAAAPIDAAPVAELTSEPASEPASEPTADRTPEPPSEPTPEQAAQPFLDPAEAPAEPSPSALSGPADDGALAGPADDPAPPPPSRDVALIAPPAAPALSPKPGRRSWGDTVRQRRSLRALQRARAEAERGDAAPPPLWQRWQPYARVAAPVLAACVLGLGLWAWGGREDGAPSQAMATGDPRTAALPSDTDPPAAGRPAGAPLIELSAAGPLAQGLADELAQALPPGDGPTLMARGSEGWAEDLEALRQPGRLAIAREDALQAARTDPALGPLQIVLPLFTEELVFVVRTDSPLRYIHQIDGRRLSVGAAESARAHTARTAYEQLFGRPLPADKTDASDEPDALRELLEGRVDVVVLVGTVPGSWPVAPALSDASQLRLLRLDRGHPASRRALRALTAVQLAAGVDGLPAAQPTTTLAVRSYLVAGASPGSEAQANDLGGLARALCRQLPTLQREGHLKWREVRVGAMPQATWPYAPEAAFAMQDCLGRQPARPVRPVTAQSEVAGSAQP